MKKTELVIIGSLAIDKIHTPAGSVEEVLGGSALYSSIAGAKFCSTGVVGVVGDDRAEEIIDFLRENSVDVDGIQVESGKTFFWEGKYFDDINQRETLSLQLGVFADFKPIVPQSYKSAKVLFLANIDPNLQMELITAVSPEIVALDTMDYWILNSRKQLMQMIPMVDVLIVNDSEIQLLAEERNIIKSVRNILKHMKPTGFVIVKKGEHGCMCFWREGTFICPAYPLEEPLDPTGAGDSFAGALLGYWIKTGLDTEGLLKGLYWASSVASFCVESFGPKSLSLVTCKQIAQRVNMICNLICRRWDLNPHVQTDTWS